VELERIPALLGAALLERLPVDPFRQVDDDAWTLSPDPSGWAQSDLVAHLCLAVVLRGSPVTALLRGSPRNAMRCRTRVDLVYTYHIRPGYELEDAALAARCGRHMLATATNEATWADCDVVVMPVQRYQPTYQLATEPYIEAVVSIDIDHDEEL
jgi:hypothetical protein